jgi:Big-like domain-containing protein
MHTCKHGMMLFALICVCIFLSSCANGGNSSAATTPVFTSTPVLTATEGLLYSYTLRATVRDGSPIVYSLVTAPSGAQLNANTITWTPAAAQSRQPNQFELRAETSRGGSATQSWTVSPNGTVTVSAVNTYWGPDGATQVPAPVGPIIIPQQNGAYATITPTTTGNGIFQFPDVPAGYYWLTRVGTPLSWYSTSSSNVDAGIDRIGPPFARQSSATTSYTLDLTGLDATPQPSVIDTISYPFGIFAYGTVQNSTTFSSGGVQTAGEDFSAIHYAIATQSEAALLGPYQGYVLGPAAIVTDLSLSNGTTNVISATFTPSPQASQSLKIDGSRWDGLFDQAAPSAPTPLGSPFQLETQPFVPQGKLVGLAGTFGQSPVLFWPEEFSQNPYEFFVPVPPNDPCRSGVIGGTIFAIAPPLIDTDVDLGAIGYGDPFPAEWQRIFTFCQKATVNLPPVNSPQTWAYTLSNWQKSAPPSGDVVPLVSPVVNATINGSSLFTDATLQSKAVTLNWSKPALGTPYGYRVGLLTSETVSFPGQPSYDVYLEVNELNTAQTSLTVPPQLLTAGKTYLFTITSLVDAAADMQTKPLRSALPAAAADVISAPIAISASAQ